MHPRKRLLLRLAHLQGGEIDRLRLVKLAFLIAHKSETPPNLRYDFVPYRYGPYSFALYRDWRALAAAGLTLDDGEGGNSFRITKAGQSLADETPDEFVAIADSTHEEWSGKTTKALIDDVYERYPWFAHRSERDGGKHKRKMQAAKLAVYTVGYQGLSVDAFLNLLISRGITHLVDTRFTPQSRVYGYHATTLQRLCGYVDISYKSEPMLGVPKLVRARFLRSRNHAKFAEDYARILNDNPDRVRESARLVATNPTAVMCYERDVHDCHRSMLARSLAGATDLETVELRG